MAVLRVLLSVLLVVTVALARPKTGNTASHDPSHADGAHSGGRLARPLEKGASSSAHTTSPSDLRRNIAAMMAHRASPMGRMGHRGPMANRGPMPPTGPRGPMSQRGPGGPMSQRGPGGPMSQRGPGGPMSQMGPRGPMSQMGPGGPMSQMGPGGPMSQMGPGGPMSPMGMRGPMPQMGPMMGGGAGSTAGRPGMMPHPPNGYPYPYPHPRPDSNETGGPTTQPRVIMTPMGPMMVPPPPPQGAIPGQTPYNGTQPGQPSPEQVQQMMVMQRMMMMREMARRAQMARMAQMAQMQRGNPGMPMGGGSGGRVGGPAGPMTMTGPAGRSEDTDDKTEEDDDHKEAADSRPKTLRDLILAARRRELQQGGRPVQMPPSGMPPSMGRPGQMPPQMMMPPVQMARAPNMPPMDMPPQMVLSQGGLHSYAPAGHSLPGTADNDDVTYPDDESPLYANAQSSAAPGGNGMPLAVNGVPGPVQLPIKDLQSLMQFEYNMQHVRTALLKSFYADLVAYRMITQQIQRRMVAKLAMIQLVEARMAMPLRGTVAMGISPPSYSS